MASTTAPTTAVSVTLMPAMAPPAEVSTKRAWHATTTLHVRRRVLLQILLLLKTKYGQVDAKIAHIARRAELALYSQAFSLVEYCNPKSLNRRLHSLVVKLHMNNLAAREDHLFEVDGRDAIANVEGQQDTRKRRHEEQDTQSTPPLVTAKRARADRSNGVAREEASACQSALFFDGNHDLLYHVSSFLGARDQLQLAATNTTANRVVPLFVTQIHVAVATLETLSTSACTTFFDRFQNLEQFEIVGDPRSHLQVDFQNKLALVRRNIVCRSLLVALARRPLPRLRSARWHYAFVDGVQDRITSEMADVLLNTAAFPQLAELSLVGNAVSDDGVSFLCDALRSASPKRSVHVLNLEQNFVGERGHVQLEQLINCKKLRGDSAPPLVVMLRGNLLRPPPATTTR